MKAEAWALPGRVMEVLPRALMNDEFEVLFRAEYPRVVAIAGRVLFDRDDAEDVAQEVFIQFHGQHPADAAYASAWLHAAAWHAALNRLRGNRRRLVRDTANLEPSVSADPATAVEVNETKMEVRRALARLPRKSAAVLALRYSGLSYAEVAAALGVGIGQVGTLLRRAETRLRKEMTQ
jgi:RNA polymerase sigma factor (sigma-70 family)